MRIERLDLLAFGGFTDHALDLSAGPRRLHLLYGPNESGKSTSLRAITGLLFGMETRTTDDFIHAKRDIRVGARLVSGQQDAQVLECIRRRGNKKTLLKPDGREPADEHLLEAMLAGVDRETFLSQFGLTHTALVEGGEAITAGNGDLGEILFAAGAGLSRLNAVKKRLEDDWKQLFLPTGSKPQLNVHLSRLKELRAQLREAQLRPADYERRLQALREAEAEAAQQQTDLQTQQQQIELKKAYRSAFPLLTRRQSLLAELEPLRDVPRLDADFVRRRREAELGRQNAEERLQQAKERQHDLQQQLEQFPEDDRVGAAAAAIQGLYEQLVAIRNARQELPELTIECGQLEQTIHDTLLDLQLPAETSIDSLRIPETLRKRLARLSERFGPLQQQCEAARTQQQQLLDEEAELRERLARLEKPTQGERVEAVLRRVGNRDLLLQPLADAQETVVRLEQRAEAKLRRLKGFSGSLEEAVALHPPLQTTLREAAEHYETASTQLRGVQEKRHETEERAAQLRCDLEAVHGQSAVPSESELQDVRQQRDDVVETLAEDLRQQRVDEAEHRVPALQQQIRTADSTADRLRFDAERVAKRAEAESQSSILQSQLESLRQRETEAQASRDAAAANWREMWQAMGVDPGTVAEMREWHEEHRQLLEIYEDLTVARAAREKADEALRRAAAELTAALPSPGLADSLAGTTERAPQEHPSTAERQGSLFAEGTSEAQTDRSLDVTPDHLTALIDAASQQLEAFRAADKRYQETLRDRERLETAKPPAARRLRDAEQQLEQWRSEWLELATKLDVDPDTTPDEVQRRCERINELFSLARQRDTLKKQIDQRQAALAAFEAETRALESQLGQQEATRDPLPVVAGLMEMLQQHRQRESKRQTLGEQRDQVEEECDTARQTLRLRDKELATLCGEARCVAVADLPRVEEASSKRGELEQQVRALDDQLTLLAGGKELTAFIEEVRSQDAETLDQEIASGERQREQQASQYDGQRETLGALRRDVQAMDGSDRAAALQQQIQDVLAKIRRDSERYATLRVANLALHAAIERYREQNQGPVLQRAEQLFRRLTNGAYEALRAELDEKDRPVLNGIRAGRSVPVQLMSEGTADALYFALRLASLETHLQERAATPLIVDDVLIQFDDQRATAALEILAELSEKTQILFFTHHQHLLDLAAETLGPNDFHLHRLAADQDAAEAGTAAAASERLPASG